MINRILKINERDNVAVALHNLEKGSEITVSGKSVVLVDDIPGKHKFFLTELMPGEEVIMYGVLVGKAQQHLLPGSLMTTENVKHAASPYGYRQTQFEWRKPDVSKFESLKFNGYHRSDGS